MSFKSVGEEKECNTIVAFLANSLEWPPRKCFGAGQPVCILVVLGQPKLLNPVITRGSEKTAPANVNHIIQKLYRQLISGVQCRLMRLGEEKEEKYIDENKNNHFMVIFSGER